MPATVTHQGRLHGASDAPVSGTIDVAFAIHDAPSGGAALWREVRSISFEEGYSSAALGETVPLEAAVLDGSVRYLGVTAGAEPEMTARATPNALVCGAGWGEVFHPVDVELAHSASRLAVPVGSTLDQAATAEAFGIAGMQVYVR